MARVGDYVGAEFGPFRIDKHIGSGQEADVFACTDRRTNLAYVLRLDASDPEVWRGPPLLPPRNASIERPNAVGSWMANGAFWRDRVASRRRDPDALGAFAVDVWGVSEDRWLIPVSAPARVRGAVDVGEIASAVPTAAGSLVWKELCQAIAAHLEPPAVIDESSLHAALGALASRRLAQDASPWIALSQADRGEASRALAALAEAGDAPPAEDNLLLRMMVAIARNALSTETARACLACRYFRANVSAGEVHQLMAAYLLVGNVVGFHSTPFYSWIAGRLAETPAHDEHDAEQFDLAPEPPDIERFDLFLQSPAGEIQQPVVLTEQPDGGYELTVGRVSL